MTIATIDIANLVVLFHESREAADRHADKHDLFVLAHPSDLEEMSGPQLVALYNSTAEELNMGLQPVKRFATKDAGITRLMANLKDLHEARSQRSQANRGRDGAQPAKSTDYPAPKQRRGTGVNLTPLPKAYPCREGTKQAILVDMLSREGGATMGELLEALSGGSKPWKEVTVKSGLNWDMNKVKGYGIRTTKRGDEDCYHLVLPEGLDAPLPHTPRKGA